MPISASTLGTWPWCRSSTRPSTILTLSAATSISQLRRSLSGNLQARRRMAPDSHLGGSAVPRSRRHAHGSPSFAANADSKRPCSVFSSATPEVLKRIGRRPRKKEHPVVIQTSPPAGTIVAAMKLKILVACSELHDVPRIRAPGTKFVRWLLNRSSCNFTDKRKSYLLLRAGGILIGRHARHNNIKCA
jgi:hypothetical protein